MIGRMQWPMSATAPKADILVIPAASATFYISVAATHSACQRHALDLAAIAEPKLHRPRRACRRVNRKKFTIYPIHFRHVRDVSQYDMHAQDTFKRRAGRLQHVPHIG